MNAIEPQELQNDERNLNAETAIRVHNLSKIYKLYPDHKARMKEALHPMRRKYHKNFYALDNVSFSVGKGEFLGILGENGSGKSTLLKIISGLLVQSIGSFEVNGSIAALIELGAGFNPEFTGIENIYFYGTILGFSREDMGARLDAIVSFADIGEYIHQPLKTYSSGMKARVAFAVAAEINPDILVIDEVLAVGDMRFTSKCLRKMHEIKNKGTTVILVTHDVKKVAVFCDRALWLKNGIIEAIGPAKEIAGMYQDFMMLGDVPKLNNDRNIKTAEFKENKRSNTKTHVLDDIEWIDLKDFPCLKKEGIKITHSALYKKDNLTKASIITRGEHVLLYLKIYSSSDLRDIVIGWNLTDKQGLVALHGNSEFCRKKIDLINKGCTLVCCFDIKMPPLRNSEYIFAFGIKQYHRIIFKVNEALPIKILSTDFNSQQGGYVIVENVDFKIICIKKNI
jgi:ABC-type polysaccharide/polyol phosphate transport system ATPase subunit